MYPLCEGKNKSLKSNNEKKKVYSNAIINFLNRKKKLVKNIHVEKKGRE